MSTAMLKLITGIVAVIAMEANNATTIIQNHQPKSDLARVAAEAILLIAETYDEYLTETRESYDDIPF